MYRFKEATCVETPEKMKQEESVEEAELPSSGEKRAMPSEEASNEDTSDLKKQRVEPEADENTENEAVEVTA